MGRVVQMERERGISPEKAGLQNVKLQLILNMCLDPELKPAAFKAAVYLLVGPGNGSRGDCFMSDHDLAECIGVSPDTVAKSILKSPTFGSYFTINRGQNRGDATEYRVTEGAILGGEDRRARGLSWLQRSDGAHVETSRRKREYGKAGKLPGFNEKGQKIPDQRGEEIPVEGRKKPPPNPEEKPIEQPNCASETEPQEEDFSSALEKFSRAYPRSGIPAKVEAAFRSAVQADVSPDDLVFAASSYAVEQKGNLPRYIALPENWLGKRRYEPFIAARKQGGSSAGEVSAVDQHWVASIKAGEEWVSRHLSSHKARGLVARGLVTAADCEACRIPL